MHAALAAVQFGRGYPQDAQKEWGKIAKDDQRALLQEAYLRDKVKWPPRVSRALVNVDVQSRIWQCSLATPDLCANPDLQRTKHPRAV